MRPTGETLNWELGDPVSGPNSITDLCSAFHVGVIELQKNVKSEY